MGNIRIRNLLFVFIILTVLLVVNAVIEFHQSKNELYRLLRAQAQSLLESMIVSSDNALATNNYLMDLSQKRLLNNAGLIRKLYEDRNISNNILSEICEENDIFHINIFDNSGRKLFSSHERDMAMRGGQQMPQRLLRPIFDGEADTLIIGLKQARFNESRRYVVALATLGRGAIVLNIDAQQMLAFKRKTGFGGLLRTMVAQNEQIIYAALQDSSEILAASGNVHSLEDIGQSLFLSRALQDSLFATRITRFGSNEILEAVHTFIFDGRTIGLFRLGISLQPLQEINDRIYRRLIILTVVLIILGTVLFFYLLTRQRLELLQQRYQDVETYSGNIIDNVSDAILVIDESSGIKIFNKAAESLFHMEKKETLGKDFKRLIDDKSCADLLQEASQINQLACTIAGENKNILVSRSIYFDHNRNKNFILVIRDITQQKNLELQLEIQNRLSAMGELAAGVAHEIRNPLNTIGTIIQQLDKDFQPSTGAEEYHDLANLVYGEVKRINETVQNFLRFSRPEPVHPRLFKVGKLLGEMKTQYTPLLSQKNISLSIDQHWDGQVKWDYNQIKQVLINLIDNAIDALQQRGTITLSLSAAGEENLILQIIDNGSGIPPEIKPRIFNLYFTTKSNGTGVGLSLVQRIIQEHRGLISVDSKPGKGTSFSIHLPINL